jgi:hypothetical protein
MTIGTASSAMISGCRTICSPWNPIEPIGERGAVCGDLDHRQAPGDARLIARAAKFHQQLLTRDLHRRELFEPGPQPLQLAPLEERGLELDTVGAVVDPGSARLDELASRSSRRGREP